MGGKVLVLGATGLFGSQAARAFAAAGWQVARFRRGGDMAAAAQGMDVIVNGLSPPGYHDWDRLIPAITDQVIAAGLASGATVLVPGNVYVYGVQPGPWGADTPQVPVARQGRIRVEMEASYRAASARGLRVILLRGGDFVDPAAAGSLWRRVILPGVARGRVVTMGQAGVRRSHAYLPDMARAAVGLAALRASLPGFADVPFAGFSLSSDDIAQAMERLTGRRMRVVGIQWWLMTALSPVWELARELREMRYLYNTDHELDSGPLQRWLPEFRATPLDDVLRAHLMPQGQGAVMSTQTGR